MQNFGPLMTKLSQTFLELFETAVWEDTISTALVFWLNNEVLAEVQRYIKASPEPRQLGQHINSLTRTLIFQGSTPSPWETPSPLLPFFSLISTPDGNCPALPSFHRGAPSPWVSGQGGGPRYPPTFGQCGAAWDRQGGGSASTGKMAALASSLIRQRREVKDPQANRQVASKRKPCPKSNKSLCQKQILILISKVRLCGSRGRKMEKRPGEFLFEGYSVRSPSPYFHLP